MTIRLGTKTRYSTILQINRAVNRHHRLSEIFSEVCGAVKRILPYQRMALSLYSPEHKALKLTAADGQGARSIYQPGLLLDLNESHHGWVFQHQKRIVRHDLHTEVEFRLEQPNVQEGIRSYCAVPLITQGESVGVMIVLSALRNRFSTAHADFLQEISDQFVLAVKVLMPACPKHSHTRMICPRCIASAGGQTTVAKHKDRLAEWGTQGGRGRRKQPGGFEQDI
jgi:formate hydrogenlyase transcriptional activator